MALTATEREAMEARIKQLVNLKNGVLKNLNTHLGLVADLQLNLSLINKSIEEAEGILKEDRG